MNSPMLQSSLSSSTFVEQWSSGVPSRTHAKGLRVFPWMHATESIYASRHVHSIFCVDNMRNSLLVKGMPPRRKAGRTRVSMEPSQAVTSEVKSRSDWNQIGVVLEELRRECDTPAELLFLLIDGMVDEMKAGLAVEGGSKDYKMILSYVDKLPSGKEDGHFYALDLGGTNFRVLRVHFGGKGSQDKDQEYQEVSIPQDVMLGKHEELFDFIAGKLAAFVSKESEEYHPLPGRKRELGFTFSFPIKQTSIDSGTLIKWTKGFAVEGTAGKDVVQALNEAMERRGLDMIVTALVNDTVGTLAVASVASSGDRLPDDEVMISVILGTGTNACYVESIDAIPKWEGPKPSSDKMIISMEWGGFSSRLLPRTQYDSALDAASVNPGEQIYEKLLSGMYLGDVVRRVLLRLAKEAALFGSSVPSKLLIPFILGTPHVSSMHQDESLDLQVVGKVLESVLGIDESSLEVRKLTVEICSIVSKRAARLAGAGIVGILKKIGRDGATTEVDKASRGQRTVVAMDGGLYEHYPLFRAGLKAAVAELLGAEAAKNVVIELSKDGSGIGAALLAAAHSRPDCGGISLSFGQAGSCTSIISEHGAGNFFTTRENIEVYNARVSL